MRSLSLMLQLLPLTAGSMPLCPGSAKPIYLHRRCYRRWGAERPSDVRFLFERFESFEFFECLKIRNFAELCLRSLCRREKAWTLGASTRHGIRKVVGWPGFFLDRALGGNTLLKCLNWNRHLQGFPGSVHGDHPTAHGGHDLQWRQCCHFSQVLASGQGRGLYMAFQLGRSHCWELQDQQSGKDCGAPLWPIPESVGLQCRRRCLEHSRHSYPSLVLSQNFFLRLKLCAQADAAEVSFWPVRIGTTTLGFARNAPTRPAWNECGKSVYRSQGYLRRFSSFLLVIHLPHVFWRRLPWTSWVVPVAGSVCEIPMLPTQHAKVDFLNLSVSFSLLPWGKGASTHIYDALLSHIGADGKCLGIHLFFNPLGLDTLFSSF